MTERNSHFDCAWGKSQRNIHSHFSLSQFCHAVKSGLEEWGFSKNGAKEGSRGPESPIIRPFYNCLCHRLALLSHVLTSCRLLFPTCWGPGRSPRTRTLASTLCPLKSSSVPKTGAAGDRGATALLCVRTWWTDRPGPSPPVSTAEGRGACTELRLSRRLFISAMSFHVTFLWLSLHVYKMGKQRCKH